MTGLAILRRSERGMPIRWAPQSVCPIILQPHFLLCRQHFWQTTSQTCHYVSSSGSGEIRPLQNDEPSLWVPGAVGVGMQCYICRCRLKYEGKELRSKTFCRCCGFAGRRLRPLPCGGGDGIYWWLRQWLREKCFSVFDLSDVFGRVGAFLERFGRI